MGISNLFQTVKDKISASAVDSPISADNSAEKRRDERFEHEFDAGLLDAQRRPATEAVRLVNMSCSGVAIESTRTFSIGDTLGLRMAFDDGNVLDAKARVRWGRELGFINNYGLEIEGIGAMARGRILRALKPDYFGIPEVLTLFLQAAATMMAAYVVVDFITSDPTRLSAMLYLFPWFCYSITVGIGLWVASIRA